MMLGEMRLEGTMYRDREPTLTGELSPELLQRAIASLPEDIYAARNTRPTAPVRRRTTTSPTSTARM